MCWPFSPVYFVCILGYSVVRDFGFDGKSLVGNDISRSVNIKDTIVIVILTEADVRV